MNHTGRPESKKEYAIQLHLLLDEAQAHIRTHPEKREAVLERLRKDIEDLDEAYAEANYEQSAHFEEETYFQKTGVRRPFAQLRHFLRTRVAELRAGRVSTILRLSPIEKTLLDETAQRFIDSGQGDDKLMT